LLNIDGIPSFFTLKRRERRAPMEVLANEEDFGGLPCNEKETAILILRSAAVCAAPAATRRDDQRIGVIWVCCGWFAPNGPLIPLVFSCLAWGFVCFVCSTNKMLKSV
jgi:hypothetical protein